MKRVLFVFVAMSLSLTACQKPPPCPAGTLDKDWQGVPLKEQVPPDAFVCELPAAEAKTHARFWVKKQTVHEANMDSVDRAQDHGWARTGDNWYSSHGDFNTPKWSEFRREKPSDLETAEGRGRARLRVDVKESNGGALVDVVYSPRG